MGGPFYIFAISCSLARWIPHCNGSPWLPCPGIDSGIHAMKSNCEEKEQELRGNRLRSNAHALTDLSQAYDCYSQSRNIYCRHHNTRIVSRHKEEFGTERKIG
jgi:hypothetical protein